MNNNRIYLTLIFGLLLVFIPILYADAASPVGRYGWMTPLSDVVGDDASCGPGEINQELYIRERGTENPVSVSSAIFAIFKRSDHSLVRQVEGPGPLVGTVCYNPDTQYFAMDIDGGPNYYDFEIAMEWSNPGILPRAKLMRTTVWVTPSSAPVEEYVHISPVNIITNINPTYRFNLNYFPTTYGATGLRYVTLGVVNYDLGTGALGPLTTEQTFTMSGGTGIKTLAAQTIPDGIYSWVFYMRLNADHFAGSGLTSLNDLKGISSYDWPFMLDRAAPSISPAVGHVPTTPYPTDTITVTGVATDTLSGISEMKVYVDGSVQKTCSFASVSSASCASDALGPYGAHTTHTYFVVATDAAGNTSTSSPQTFTIAPVITASTLSCAAPRLTVIDKAPANAGVFNASVVTGTPQALDRAGNYLYVGASGSSDAQGLYIYDISDRANMVQRSFFSTVNPASVQNYPWGNDVLGVDVEGNYAYLATYVGGLVIVDVSNPDSPTFVGKLALTGETWDVDVRGNYAYLASGTGLRVVDISNKANPTVAATLNLSSGSAPVPHDVVLDGNYAYIALANLGFAIVNISTPTSPTVVAQKADVFKASGPWAYSIAYKDDYLFVGEHFSGNVRVFSIADPANPVFVKNISAPSAGGWVRELYVAGDVLYVGVDEAGAYVFDITNPSEPSLLYQFSAADLGESAIVWNVIPLDAPDFTSLAMVSESSGNGVYVTDIVCEPTADLVAASSTVSVVSLNAGETITFGTGDIKNGGTADASGYAIGGFYIDSDGDDTANYTQSVGDVVLSTPVDGAQTQSATWTVPNDAVSGTYRVGYLVNEPEGFTEITRANNWSGWTTFTVQGNEPPVVDAGGDQAITLPAENESGAIGASATDADGSIAQIVWNFISGPGPVPTIIGGNTLTPVFQGLLASGVYLFRVTATDNLGAQTSDEMEVVVDEVPSPSGWVTVNPGIVDSGETALVSWGLDVLIDPSTNCTVASTKNSDSWIGQSGVNQVTSPLYATAVYALVCDSVPIAQQEVVVNPEVIISASSRVVRNGDWVDVSWNTNGNDEALCSLSGGGLTNSAFNGTGVGVQSVRIYGKTTFTLTCGAKSASTVVELKPYGWET